MKKVDFVFFDAGGGHRAAATALKAVAEQQERQWQVRLVNLQEVLEPLDIFQRYTGVRGQDVYNKMLAKGWTLGSEVMLPAMHGLIRMYHRSQKKMLAEFWRQDAPDMVVSVIPNFNRALYQGLQQVSPRTSLVTILTDLADYPPHFWMERQDQYLICGTDRAMEQANRVGYKRGKVFRTSGMILRPLFYEQLTHDRAVEREKLGLDPQRPTAIVLFGGQGSNVMLDIAKEMQGSGLDLQAIFVCGKNAKLAAKLRQLPTRVPFHVVEFTNNIPYYMDLADFFVGKPGPGSISEAIAMRLPVIVERNAWTLPQERYNTEWVREKQVGMVLRSFGKINAALDEMLEHRRFTDFKANVERINNHAVFEIPDILDNIMANGSR